MSVKPEDLPPAQELANETLPGAVPPPPPPEPRTGPRMVGAMLATGPTYLPGDTRTDDTMTPAELAQYREVQRQKESYAALAGSVATRAMQGGATQEEAVAAAKRAVEDSAANFEQQVATSQGPLAAPVSRRIAQAIDENLTARNAGKMAIQAAIMAAATYATGGGALVAAGSGAIGNLVSQAALNKPGEAIDPRQALIEGATVGISSKIPLGGIGRALGKGTLGTTVAGGVREGVQETSEEAISAALEGRPITGEALATAGILGAIYGPVFEVALGGAGVGGDIEGARRAAAQAAAQVKARGGSDAIAAQAAGAAAAQATGAPQIAADVTAALNNPPAEPGSPAAPFGSAAAPVSTDGMTSLLAQFSPEERAFLASQGLIDEALAGQEGAAPAAPAEPAPTTAAGLAAAAGEVTRRRRVRKAAPPPTGAATPTAAVDEGEWQGPLQPTLPETSPDFRTWVDQMLGPGTYAGLESHFRSTGDASGILELRQAHQQALTGAGDPGATAALADIQTGPLARNAVSEQARQYEQQRLAAARLAPPPTAPAAGHYSVMRGPDGLFYVATVTEPDVTRREAEGETGPGAPGRRSIMGPFREGTAAETAAGLMNQRFTDQFGAAPEPGSLGDLDPQAVMDWERKNAREVFRGAPPAARRGGKNVGSGRAQPAVHEPGTAARLKAEAAAATAAATVPGGKKAPKRAPRKRNPRGAPPPAAPAATPLAGNVDAMLAGLKAQAAEAEKSRAASKAAAKTPPAKSASARVPVYGRDLEADLAKVKGKTVSGELVAKYGLPLGVRKVADVRAYVQEQIRQVAANMPTEPAATPPAAEPDDAGVLADIKEAVRRAKSAEQLAGVLEITPEEAQALIDGRDAEGPTAMADVMGIGMIQQFVDRAKVRKAAQVLRKVEQSRRAKLAGQPRQASGFSGRDSARAWGAGHYQSVDAAVTDALDALAAGRTTGPTGGVLSHERLPSGIDVITEEMPAGTAEPEWDFGNDADTPLLNPEDWGLDDPTLADAPEGPLLKTTLRAPRAAAEMRENGTVFALSQRPDVAGSPAASMDTIRVLRAAAERGGRFEEASNISPQSEDMYRAVSRFSGIPVADLPGMAIADVLSSPGAQRVMRLMDIRDAAAQQRGGGGATAMADPFGFQTLYNAGQKLWGAATGSPGGAGPKAGRVGSALVTGPRSTLEHLSDLGPNGKAIAELFQIYRDAKETLHGRWSATLDQALRKVPESERSAFTDLLEGRVRAASAGTQQAVTEARGMLDEVARYAQTNERFTQYLADYFPRIMAERPSLSRKAKAAAQDFWADPTHKTKMQAMGITNWSDPGAAAYAASVLMFPGGRRYGTLAPNLEKHRTGMLQEYRTDPEVLYQYIGQAAKAISHAMAFDNPRVTGPTKSGVANERYGGWKEMWGRLALDPTVDEDTATGLKSALERELGIEQDKPTAGSKVEQSVRDIVASTSLALSFLNQPQSFSDTAATMGLGESLSALKQIKSQAAVDAAVRAGSVRSQNEAKGRSYAEETALAQQPGATGALGDVAKFYRDLPWMNWMQNIDRAMRITADAASRASLDKTVAGINTGDKATLAILKAAGVDPQSLAGLSQQDIQAAMSYGQMSRPAQTAVDTYARRMVELTQQRARPGDLPKSWSTPRGQWISMFMPFKYRQMKSMAAAFKANPKRFIASGLPAYIFLGATTAAMRAVLTGYGVEGEENDEQTTQEKFMSIFGNRPIRPDSPEDLLLRIAQTLARTLPTPMVMTAAQRFQRAGDAGDAQSAILGPVSRLVQGGSAAVQGVQGRGRPTEISPAEWAARGIGTGAALIGGPSAYSYQIQRELMGPTTDFPRKTVPTPAAPGLVGRLLDLKRGETTVGQTVKGVTIGGPDTVSAKRKKRRENIKTNKAQREKLAGEARTYETMRGVPRFQ